MAIPQAGWPPSPPLFAPAVLNVCPALRGDGYRRQKRGRGPQGKMQMSENQSSSRKTVPRIRVPVYPAEYETIKQNARAAGMKTAPYLRALGLGFQIRGVLDQDLVRQLAKINADQGRLGGLLKLWLTNTERVGGHLDSIDSLMLQLHDTQMALLKLVSKV